MTDNGRINTGRIRHPPTFHGRVNEDARDWKARSEEAADFNKWEATDRLKHVRVYLGETARQWSYCHPVGTPAT